jgi:poly(3-hydroxybutyrate) depolymerase
VGEQLVYGPLKPPPAVPAGRIVEFDQSEFLANPASHSMNPVRYAFIPSTCDEGATCRVHIAFHGCRQQTARIGERFYRFSGYNEWAEANKLIVLYPQATNSDLPPVYNPRGCWDWWGYDDPDYAKKRGRQMAAVKGMLDRLSAGYQAGPPAPPRTWR